MDYAERKMRAAIAAMPDGTWRFEDVFDNEEVAGLLPLAVEVTVKGDQMSLAFDAPDADARRHQHDLHGAARHDLLHGEVGARSHHPAQCRPGAAAHRHRARGQHPQLHAARGGQRPPADLPAGRRHGPRRAGAGRSPSASRPARTRPAPSPTSSASGPHDQSGSTWVYLETIGGGSGARATKDGLDGVHVHTTNTSNLPVEALEIEYPLKLLRYELVADSGGAGQYRGGMGLRRVYQATHDCRVRVDITRQRSQSWGLFGGGPGGHGKVEAGPGRGVRRRQRRAQDRPVVRRGDARRRRLRPARQARSGRRGARSRRGRGER